MRVQKAAVSAAFFVCAISLVVLLVPFPSASWVRHAPALFREIENLGHPVVFALLTAFTLRHWPRYAIAATVLVLFGAVTELLQQFTGRDASLRDFVSNMSGVVLGIALHARPRHPRLLSATAVVIATLCLLPLLWTALAYVHRSQQAPVIWRAGSLLSGRFSHWQRGGYPGLAIDEPLRDWSGYRELQVALANPHRTDVQVTVRAHDWNHNQQFTDRYNQTFTVPAGDALLRIPIERIATAPAGRTMDLSSMSSVMVFQPGERHVPLDIEFIQLAR
ncbi:MAG: hypothetical protein M3Y79_01305 [Pseudomonadota bacterium]|nr:hypothetical protein [Pseudomonadota bacterium]